MLTPFDSNYFSSPRCAHPIFIISWKVNLMFLKPKSNFRYTRWISPKLARVGRVYHHAIASGLHSFIWGNVAAVICSKLLLNVKLFQKITLVIKILKFKDYLNPRVCFTHIGIIIGIICEGIYSIWKGSPPETTV